MVVFCAIIGCANRGGRDTDKSFFRLPSIILNQGDACKDLSEKKRRTWLSRINRADMVESSYTYIRVCSDHFISGKPASLQYESDPDWAPSLRLGYDTLHRPGSAVKAAKRAHRLSDRKQKIKVHSAARSLLDLARPLPIEEMEHNIEEDLVMEVETCTKEISIQTDLSGDMISGMEQELNRLRTLTTDLKAEVASSRLTVETFEQDDEKVRLFTGLPSFTLLLALYTYVSPFLQETRSSSLNKFQQLMLVLMRLRLNHSMYFLSVYFNISRSTASRYFLSVLNVLYVRMTHLVHWPDREELRKTMPMEFRKYFGMKVAVIIDCFEVFIERPSNLVARAQTWSNYKHHNTVKFLIGITPQGIISYISKGYGGRSSDKFITGDCGFLNKLVPGDLVLADRGFDISEDVALMCAEVKIPAFTKGKSQLSAVEIEQTRKIAHVRIHVERVIGNLRKKYSILQDIVPLDFLSSNDGQVPTIDKIINVTCALTNMCDSVVPID